MRIFAVTIVLLIISACQTPIDMAPGDACKMENKGKNIRVTGKLSYGNSYMCKPDFGKSYCSAGFTDLDGNHHMYLNIPEGRGPNQIDVRDKDPADATVFDSDGTLVKPGEPVTVEGRIDTVVEYEGSLVCTVKVRGLERK